MTAVWLVVRSALRQRWRSWLLLAVLAGLAGGLVVAVAAGARRTDAAYPGLVSWSKPPDDLISLGFGGTFASVSARTAEHLPQVTGAARLTSFTALEPAAITVMAPADNAIPGQLWNRKLLAGRLPDPRAPAQADISFTVAQAEHVAVGGTLRVILLGADGKPVPFSFTVAGIDAAPGEFPPQYGTGIDTVWATPAFTRRYGRQFLEGPAVALRLRDGGADVPAVEREITRLSGGKVVSDYPLAAQAANTEHSIHLQAVALWLLAALLAVLGLLVLGQLLARLSVLESANHEPLRAVGITPAQLMAAELARAGMIGAAGGVIAAALAVAVSPLFPVGLAGIAEPSPGVYADWPVLGLGMLGLVACTMCCAVLPAWRAASSRARLVANSTAGSPGAGAVARLAWPVTAATGVRLVLQRGGGRTAVPVRTTVSAAAVGIAGLCAALVFTASLANLLGNPRLYGVTWDAIVANVQNATMGSAASSVAADPSVARWSGMYMAVPLTINGVAVGAITAGPGPGPGTALAVVPLAGNPPRQAGDIVLGQRTLAAIGAHIGDTVTVSIVGVRGSAPRKVVGTAVFPAVADSIELGTGAELTVGGLLAMVPAGITVPPFSALVVKFRSGAGSQRELTALATRLDKAGPFAVAAASTPADLVNFGQLQDLPLLLGLALGGLALLTIAHLLLTAARRRRRDLAVLRALGFTRGQVRGTVCWMAVTVAAAALLAGVPAGLVCGRLAWHFFTGQLGIAATAVSPPLSFAALVAAAIVLAIGIAVIPGDSAGRGSPAASLRAELAGGPGKRWPAPTNA